jgi:glycosyltransferase involved in cell wall biosynthesis
MARVTVGLPVYNGERYLGESIDAILSQTFQDLELIISDNASTDKTADICRDYAKRDKRVRYSRSPENLGAAWNFNRVFELAESEYFKWATADDFSAPEQIEKCVNVLDSEPAVVLCYPRTTIIDEDGNVVRPYADNLDLRFSSPRERLRHFIERVGLCNAHYGMIRSSALRQTRLLRSYPGSDVVMLGELTLYGQFFEIPEYLFYRRFHPEASSSVSSFEELQAFYSPKTKGNYRLHLWRDQFEYLSSVFRSPLTTRERVQVVCMLLRTGISSRRELAAELFDLLRQMRRRLR